MKTFLRYFIITSFALISLGCLQQNTMITLRPDGSGTIRQAMMFNRGISKIVELVKGLGGDADIDFSYNLYDENELKRDAREMGKGVRYKSSKEVRKGDYEGYNVTYEFDDINELKLSAFQHEESRSAYHDGISFHFEKGSTPTLYVRMDHDVNDDGNISVSTNGDDGESDLSTVKNFLEGMRFAMTIEIDGDIQRTNATFREGNRIVLYEVEVDKIENLDALERLNNSRKRSIKETRDILKDIKGVKVELNDEMKVSFK